MNQARFDSIMRNASSISKKVYEAVPMRGAWDKGAILAEIKRSGTSTDKRMVEGCLSSLKSQGLIQETAPGRFIRTTIKRKNPMRMRSVDSSAAEKPNQEPEPITSPLDRLERLAERDRGLEKQAADLAQDIDATAVAVDDALKACNEEGEKYRQLKSLLKGLD